MQHTKIKYKWSRGTKHLDVPGKQLQTAYGDETFCEENDSISCFSSKLVAQKKKFT